MDRTQDTHNFITAIQRLSTAALIGELTKERIAVFWDALSDLPIESVLHACKYAVRAWQPSEEQRFFLPATLREYAKAHLADQEAQAKQAHVKHLPPPDTTDAEVRAALRTIFQRLDEAPRLPRQPESDPMVLAAAGQRNPPDPTRWLPLTEDLSRDQRPHQAPAMAHLVEGYTHPEETA